QTVRGLDPNTVYAVRLVATTGGGDVTSDVVVFTTDTAPPRVALTFADALTRSEARLGAHVDPAGSQTTYTLGGGPTAAYGDRVPAFERQLGAGNDAVVVNEAINGLQPATTYHYRVVTTSAAGTTYGPDQTFETLNSCGLTDDRCYELVSPADKGP